MAKNIRIFQIAKDLNISHTEILTFLKKKGVDVASHMTPVDEDIQDIIDAFEKVTTCIKNEPELFV